MPDLLKPREATGHLVVWTRPPLLTGVKLGAVAIDDVTPLASRLNASELIRAYEEFIHGYILGDDLAHRRPYAWVRNNLGLAKIHAQRVAPVVLRKSPPATPLDWLAIVLWVIHRCVKGSKLTLTGPTMLVESGGTSIGVDDGTLLSGYAKPHLLPCVPDFNSLLRTHSVGVRQACNREALNRYYLEAGKQKEGPALQLALRALYFQLVHPERLENRLYCAARRAYTRSIVNTVREGIKHTDNPRLYLRKMLVPNYTSIADFITQFGNPYREYVREPSPSMIEGWLQAVESIINEADQ